MPIFYLRGLTGRERSERANRHLAWYLAFIAGAADAGGFFAVHHYTSHMSGVVSSIADASATDSVRLVMIGVASVLAFFAGSFLTTLFVRWARARDMHSGYAFPLFGEALLLLLFGMRGAEMNGGFAVVALIVLLSFSMGLQNALITKLSDAVIRTTHVTGMVTDIGIAVGRIVSGQRDGHVEPEHELDTIRLLSSLIALFFIGGVAGAVGFRHLGFLFAVPLALILLLLAGVPVADDVLRHESAAA